MTPNSPSWERLYDHGPSHRRPSSCSRSVPKTPDLVLLCLGIGSRSETVDQDQLGVGAGLPGLQPGLALGRLVEFLRRPAGLSGLWTAFPRCRWCRSATPRWRRPCRRSPGCRSCRPSFSNTRSLSPGKPLLERPDVRGTGATAAADDLDTLFFHPAFCHSGVVLG